MWTAMGQTQSDGVTGGTLSCILGQGEFAFAELFSIHSQETTLGAGIMHQLLEDDVM